MSFNQVVAKRHKDTKIDHLFKARSKTWNPARKHPEKDFSRIVKWPAYITKQRKKAILKKRLKIPPPVYQFSITANENLKTNLFALLKKYRTESKVEKRKRLREIAELESKEDLEGKEYRLAELTARRISVRFGLDEVTKLVERKKAKLVVIAADIEPLEIVLFLPTLCRKMDIPYVIVKSKSELGRLVHRRKAITVALTEVRKGKDDAALAELVKSARENFNKVEFKNWGGGELGFKSAARAKKKEAELKVK